MRPWGFLDKPVRDPVRRNKLGSTSDTIPELSSGLNMLVCVHAPRTHAHAHTNTESQLAVVARTCSNNSWKAEAGGS